MEEGGHAYICVKENKKNRVTCTPRRLAGPCNDNATQKYYCTNVCSSGVWDGNKSKLKSVSFTRRSVALFETVIVLSLVSTEVLILCVL